MDISEFIDSYSDDLILLREGRLALLTHPLHPNEATAYLMDASICRMLAIIVIGSIEAMLSAWVERDRVDVLQKYFAEGVRNGERIQSLYEAFHNAGIAVDRDVFDDYLAVKYIRNTIIHGKWKPDEKEWVAGRGFPTDSRQLTAEHWTRIEHVNESMMLYIALTSYATPDKSTKRHPQSSNWKSTIESRIHTLGCFLGATSTKSCGITSKGSARSLEPLSRMQPLQRNTTGQMDRALSRFRHSLHRTQSGASTLLHVAPD
jgi:hypothetical protein